MIARTALRLLQLLTMFTVITGSDANGARYRYDGLLVGEDLTYLPAGPLRLPVLARSNGLGINELKAANSWLLTASEPDRMVTLPLRHILPQALIDESIVINLSEPRLYYLHRDANGEMVVDTMPVAVGKNRTPTPAGKFRIIEKIKNPWWNVPRSILAENPALPPRVAPGPKNPLGKRALRLTNSGVMIHGTIEPDAIGKWVSHGCIRMYPENIAELFEMVPLHTPVQLVRQPVKIAKDASGALFVEIHRDPFLRERTLADYTARAISEAGISPELIDADKLQQAIITADGVVREVGLTPPATSSLDSLLVPAYYSPQPAP